METKSDDEAFIYPSGNDSWAYLTEAHFNSLEEERKKTAFAIFLHYPYVEELNHGSEAPETKWFTQDDIEVQLACIMHDKSNKGKGPDSAETLDDSSKDPGGSGSEDEGGDEDLATAGARLNFVTVFLGLAATVAINMI